MENSSPQRHREHREENVRMCTCIKIVLKIKELSKIVDHRDTECTEKRI